jgi:hypothetical protein
MVGASVEGDTDRDEIWKVMESEMGSAEDTDSDRRFDEMAGTSRPDGPMPTETEFLFVGVDEATVFTHEVGTDSGLHIPLWDGSEPWAATYVPQTTGTQALFFSQGSEIWGSFDGAPPGFFCDVTETGTGNAISPVGMAWNSVDNLMMVSRNIGVEGIWMSGTCEMSLVIAFDPTLGDLGGLAFDGQTNTIYATNDDPDLLGIVEVDPSGTLTLVAPYPAGETDIDGLAYGEGKLFLVTDEPGDIYVYDLDAGAYVSPLPGPWTTSEIFSGAAFWSYPFFADGFESGDTTAWDSTTP